MCLSYASENSHTRPKFLSVLFDFHIKTSNGVASITDIHCIETLLVRKINANKYYPVASCLAAIVFYAIDSMA